MLTCGTLVISMGKCFTNLTTGSNFYLRYKNSKALFTGNDMKNKKEMYNV